MSNQSELLGDVNPRVLNSAFEVPEQGFGSPLDIDNHNLNQIEKLSTNKSSSVEVNYLKVATAYIIENVERATSWIEFDAAASCESLINQPKVVRELLLELPAVDQQALASMRLYAALHSYSDDAIREYLNKNMPSDWSQTRLLYPLIYYVTNLPNSVTLDQMLAHVFPDDGTGPAERILTKFLLEPSSPATANLALRCYVSLISHPFDALEYVTTDLERRIAEREPINRHILDEFSKLADVFPGHRIATLVALAKGCQLPFLERPTKIASIDFPDNCDEKNVLLDILDLRVEKRPALNTTSPILKSLIGMRWSRYPTDQQFEELNAYSRRFAMLSSGRLVLFISTSLFIFGRESAQHETHVLLQGLLHCESWSPFIASGPQGYSMMATHQLPYSASPSELVRRTNENFGGHGEARSDRIWIKAANWDLMESQSSGKVVEWAKSARPKFPIWVHPRYLSGLDWQWLDEFIASFGMRPLIGNFDFVYILFIKQLEEFKRESMPLRVAIEPIIRDNSGVEGLGNWLDNNLAEHSLAFIRFFLNADTILKLRLTDNYMAAVSFRLELLERGVRKHGFIKDTFDESELRREQDALSAILCRMSVGSRQFEIGWATLADNAIERTRDTYDAYDAISGSFSDQSIGDTKRASSYQFSNGAVGDYESRNRDWPLVLLIAGVIDTFLTHPTTGIEAILSVRIRHDAFRREYENAILQVRNGQIVGVSGGQVKYLIPKFSGPVYREVQQWLDVRMHASRKAKPKSIFNFVPTKAEMNELMLQAFDQDFDTIVALVFEWIKPRLNEHLTVARHSLARDLGKALDRCIDTVKGGVDSRKNTEDVRRTADAISAAVSRRTLELDEWFKIPETDRKSTLRVAEIMNAVRQRFSLDRAKDRLKWSALPQKVASRTVEPAHVRHLYDLLSEVAQNALKHSERSRTVIRMSCPDSLGGRVILLSNAKECTNINSEDVPGHPFETLQESIFGEGNSGTKKIAYLAASIAKRTTTIQVCETAKYFHLVIPIEAFGERPGLSA